MNSCRVCSGGAQTRDEAEEGEGAGREREDEEPEAAEGGGPRRVGWKCKNWKQDPEEPVTGQKGGGIAGI